MGITFLETYWIIHSSVHVVAVLEWNIAAKAQAVCIFAIFEYVTPESSALTSDAK